MSHAPSKKISYVIIKWRISPIETEKKIDAITSAAFDKKAEDVVVMDMAQRSSICTAFILMSAPSTVRVKAIVDGIETEMEAEGLRVFHKEGYADASWVLMDYGDVIVHVFYHEKRRFYDLENLWGDAPKRNILPTNV